MIRVVIVDDQTLFREMLQENLQRDSRFQVVGNACNGEEAVALCRSLVPDLILMDLQMPLMDGAAATRCIKKEHPEIRVLVLTTFDDEETMLPALKAGIDGYVLKTTSGNDLFSAMENCMKGFKVLDESAFTRLVDADTGGEPSTATRMGDTDDLSSSGDASLPPTESLQGKNPEFSDMELNILRLLLEGYDSESIARQLYISYGTLRNYISRMLTRHGFRDRVQLVAYCVKKKYL